MPIENGKFQLDRFADNQTTNARPTHSTDMRVFMVTTHLVNSTIQVIRDALFDITGGL